MRTLRCLAIFLASVLSFASLRAQTVSFLNVPEGAESLAVGGFNAVGDAVSALNDGVVDADVSYYRWSPKGVGSNIINADVSCRFNKIAILADFATAGNGEYPLYDENGADLGVFKPNDMMVGLGAAYAVTPRISVSLMAKYVGSRLAPEAKASAFCADINAVYRYKTWTVGLLAANIGTKLNYSGVSVPLPMMLKVGAHKNFAFGEKLQLGLGLDAGYLAQSDYNSILVCAGADLKMFDLLSVRAGYHLSSNHELEPSYVSAGLGVDVSVVSLSAAFLFGSPVMNGTLCATLGVRF